MSYLKQQYKVVASVFLALVVLFSIMAYGFGVQNEWVPIAFLTGGFFSGLAGFLGMKTATYASARTANAARSSLNSGLQVAFRSGAVMGLVVVGLGLLDISFWYILLNICIPAEAMDATHKLTIITTTMLTFGMGASTQALFARVGGGIYTKAADVGADLKEYDDVGLAIQDMVGGRLDAVICDSPVAMYYVNKKADYAGKLNLSFKTDDKEYYGFTVRKGRQDLVDKLNKGIKQVKESGLEAKLIEKWMGTGK